MGWWVLFWVLLDLFVAFWIFGLITLRFWLGLLSVWDFGGTLLCGFCVCVL